MSSDDDPREYLRKVCELHLGEGAFPNEDDPIELFLQQGGQLVFGPGWQINPTSGGGPVVVFAAAAGPVTHRRDIQSWTLASPTSNESQLQSLLQVYTRTMTTTEAAPAVQDALRALQVALQQQRQHARLPHVVLAIHPAIQAGGGEIQVTDDLLNELQAGVSDWIAQIRPVTTLSAPLDGAAEELAFWTQLSAELEHIAEQLSSEPVQQTLHLLREAQRFVATVALENNTGLEQAQTTTKDSLTFVKGYPLPKLQAAGSFEQVSAAVVALFEYLPKVRSSRYYSLERSAELLQATTLVLKDVLWNLLQKYNLLFMDFATYEKEVRFPVLDVFVQFDDRLAEWKEFLLEQARRRKLKGLHLVLEQLTLHHKPLQERLEQIHSFKSTHEHLRQVVHTVLRDQDPSALAAVEQAPRQILGSLAVLDLSPAGSQALESALDAYEIQMDALEERLAKLLRDKLTACQDAEDMFRVFARFNLLLTRTRVRAAVKEFQMQLIATVSTAIETLRSKFTEKYELSSAAKIARLRGIPPVSGKIMWAKQMERQVETLMERMSHVLGPDWGQQLEGRQLRKSGDELLAKLDARSFFRNWVIDWERELTSAATSRMNSYPIIVEPEGRDGRLVAKVNFDEKREILFKEIRHLKWLGFGKEIPKTLIMVSDEALERYPHAISIKTALRSYQSMRLLVTAELEPLVQAQLEEIRELIAEAYDIKLSTSTAASKKRRIRWDSKELPDWVSRLSDAVSKFEDRVEQLLRACDKVDIALNVLEQVEYKYDKFRAVILSIQKTIDEMSMSGYSDLDSWVSVVSTKMSEVLAKRLETALRAWNAAFKIAGQSADETERSEHTVVGDFPEIVLPADVATEIVLRNQEIMAVPSVPAIRSLFLDRLHEFVAAVCALPLPKSGRYEVFDSITAKTSSHGSDEIRTFDHVIEMLPDKLVAEAYGAIEGHVSGAAEFVDKWMAYQTLWDTQVADVASNVGSDINKWQDLLMEASDARATLDSSATDTRFGPIVVRYGKVQSQINLKYDSWQKELQASFASVLGRCIEESKDKVADAKQRLEESSLDGASTESVVVSVTFIQEAKQKSAMWAKELDSLRESEKLLKRQRFAFGSDWVESSVVKGLHDSLLQILERRSRSMEQQIPILQTRVNAEDKKATKEMTALLESWENDKPLRGNMSPPQALELLSTFEVRMKKAHVHEENLLRAKDALGLEHSTENTKVLECLNELKDLQEVWEATTGPFNELEALKDTPWTTAVMRKVKRGLDDILAGMRSLPNRIRQYDAYVQLHEVVKGFVSGHGLLSDLKTEALKERHWKTILQRLGIRVPFTDLTVGLLWDNGLLSRKKDIHEILTVAQGEMALEVFLGEVRDRWTKQELELVLFQNRTRLIKGWDELFATLDDHIGGLALMKSSPYYRAVREFQEEGRLWEDRLTKLRAAFDAWVDVQRRWVYLEGILFGSSDIKAQLPAEWSRFKSVDSEFIALMRRISAKPYAMEVLNIDNLQRTLEKLGNLMTVIQRALGEYLAKQRSDFSRFYFLGDDDLLEIMGNSGEPGKVLAHIGKMFAGIATARSVTDGLEDGVKARFDAMISKDGEVVVFDKPIDITSETPVKVWLMELENRMQTTLALLLEQAVAKDSFSSDIAFDDSTCNQFVEWASGFPAQVMILAAQINWSHAVDSALATGDTSKALGAVLRLLEWKLEVMAKTVLQELPPDSRKKFEQLITELVRQRDVVRQLIDDNVSSQHDFRWLYHLRYNYNPKSEKLTEKLTVSLSNASFYYGFEYLGIGERLVQTPLTDKCYLTLTQALHFRMGGSPFGPAGTGKTESVKALGAALGRFVLVFNCDETFDFSAMGRLLAGLSQVGAWGCFDEFNRLEERILSAVSQQILTIQRGLIERRDQVELLGRSIKLHENVGIFITMNPVRFPP